MPDNPPSRDAAQPEAGDAVEPRLGPRQEETFRLLVEAVTDYAIFLLGPDGRIRTWNLGAQRIKGYTAEEVIGQHFSIFYTPEERELGRPERNLADAARQGRVEDEGWRVRKDGSRFWADVVITRLLDRSGRLYGFGKVTRDLTERREAEARERQLAAEQRAREASELALRARTRFLTIASHELKTPVASLQLSIEALIRAHRRGMLGEERLERSLARMASAGARLTTLVNELLDVSRLEASSVELDLQETDLTSLISEALEQFADTGHGDRLQLRAPARVLVSADPVRLEQVVTNLIDNALKYSPPDSMVDVEVAEADGGAVLRVTDQGIGMDPDASGWLFEPFGRGANTAHVQGIGLGLYISRQIVENHGGRIEANSPGPGRGTAFTVWLPHHGPTPGRESSDAPADATT